MVWLGFVGFSGSIVVTVEHLLSSNDFDELYGLALSALAVVVLSLFSFHE
jgi:hypothetical protein